MVGTSAEVSARDQLGNAGADTEPGTGYDMRTTRSRILPIAALSALAVTLATGCGNDGGSSNSGGSPTATTTAAPSASDTGSGEDHAREVVQNYLDAMETQDLTKGKEQMCPALHEQFEKKATGEDGDFSSKLTVKDASVTKVEPKGDEGHRVTTTMVVQVKAAGANPVKADLAFDVHKLGDLWCIYNEEIVGKPTPAS